MKNIKRAMRASHKIEVKHFSDVSLAGAQERVERAARFIARARTTEVVLDKSDFLYQAFLDLMCVTDMLEG